MGSSGWHTDPREVLKAGPDFDLASFDRGATPGFDGSKSDAQAVMASRGDLLAELQERLYAHGRAGGNRKVLCVVQGIDTAGKGGVARHVMGMVDPQGVALRSFGVPTKEEREHHYLWRIKKALPPAGRIGVFDRSHYEDVLVVRVDGLVEPEVWEPRFEEINRFEQSLVDDDMIVLKFALMVDYEEQGLRLMERLDRPDKRWKFSENDIPTRAKWDAYQEAYQDVLQRTSTEAAPWYVIPANRKWYSHLAITEILTQTMAEMDLEWPQPEWDVFEMREKLAETMSVDSLKESLAETEETVRDAIEADAEVDRRSVEIRLDSPDTSEAVEAADRKADLAKIKAESAMWLAELMRTREQKQQLVKKAKKRVKGEK